MTSEVVVMNRLAVALAADSAATVTAAGGTKVWNSANKLFALSRCHPVGVMVYNGASILGIPWETIIKMYRSQLGAKSFPRLEQYVEDFTVFLNSHPRLFPSEQQHVYFRASLKRRFDDMLAQGQNAFYESFLEPGQSTDRADYFKAVANGFLSELEGTDRLDSSVHSETAVEAELGESINAVVGELSTKAAFSVDEHIRAVLYRIGVLTVTRRYFGSDYTGIVFAGFGDDEHFPVLYSFQVGGVVLGATRCSAAEVKSVSGDERSIIQPFAQSAMVDTFLRGISPPFANKIVRNFVALGQRMPAELIDQIDDLTDDQKEQWKARLAPNVQSTIGEFLSEFRQHFMENHWTPIHDALVHLPKDDLAEVAEALVNLNSFQQRVSLQEETVGGPIDVAVISKGDGLVWIKRKHYFSRELNEHYFNNLSGSQAGGGHA